MTDESAPDWMKQIMNISVNSDKLHSNDENISNMFSIASSFAFWVASTSLSDSPLMADVKNADDLIRISSIYNTIMKCPSFSSDENIIAADIFSNRCVKNDDRTVNQETFYSFFRLYTKICLEKYSDILWEPHYSVVSAYLDLIKYFKAGCINDDSSSFIRVCHEIYKKCENECHIIGDIIGIIHSLIGSDKLIQFINSSDCSIDSLTSKLEECKSLNINQM